MAICARDGHEMTATGTKGLYHCPVCFGYLSRTGYTDTAMLKVTSRAGDIYICDSIGHKTLGDGCEWLILFDASGNELNVIRQDAVWNIEFV